MQEGGGIQGDCKSIYEATRNTNNGLSALIVRCERGLIPFLCCISKAYRLSINLSISLSLSVFLRQNKNLSFVISLLTSDPVGTNPSKISLNGAIQPGLERYISVILLKKKKP